MTYQFHFQYMSQFDLYNPTLSKLFPNSIHALIRDYTLSMEQGVREFLNEVDEFDDKIESTVKKCSVDERIEWDDSEELLSVAVAFTHYAIYFKNDVIEHCRDSWIRIQIFFIVHNIEQLKFRVDYYEYLKERLINWERSFEKNHLTNRKYARDFIKVFLEEFRRI